jgi:hypothetical protein
MAFDSTNRTYAASALPPGAVTATTVAGTGSLPGAYVRFAAGSESFGSVTTDGVQIWRRLAVCAKRLTDGQVAAFVATGSTIDAGALTYDSGTVAAEVSDDSGGNLVLVLPGPASGRYLWLDLAASGATAIDIGRIVAGPLWQPLRSYAYGIVEGRQINDRVDINPLTGARFPVPALANPRFAKFTLPLLTTAEARGEFRALTRALGGVGDLLWIPDIALSQAELNNRSLWGAAAAPGDLAGASRTASSARRAALRSPSACRREPMPNAEEVARQIAVHEAVCAERWKQTNARLSRIEAVLAVIVLLLLIGEGSVIDVLKRVLGG